MPEENTQTTVLPVPPREDLDDLIFRWEAQEWLASER